METRSCPTCRSVNHADLARCMNCGAAMNLVPAPATDVGSPKPPSVPAAYGWSAQVAAGPPTPRRHPWAAIAIGAIVVFAPIVLFLLRWTAESSTPGVPGQLQPIWLGSWFLVLAYSVWMMFDAFSSRRIGWGIAILFLGPVAGLIYAMLAMSPPSARRRD